MPLSGRKTRWTAWRFRHASTTGEQTGTGAPGATALSPAVPMYVACRILNRPFGQSFAKMGRIFGTEALGPQFGHQRRNGVGRYPLAVPGNQRHGPQTGSHAGNPPPEGKKRRPSPVGKGRLPGGKVTASISFRNQTTLDHNQDRPSIGSSSHHPATKRRRKRYRKDPLLLLLRHSRR